MAQDSITVSGYFLPNDTSGDADSEEEEEQVDNQVFEDLDAVADCASFLRSKPLVKKNWFHVYNPPQNLWIKGNFLMTDPWWAPTFKIKNNGRIRDMQEFAAYRLRNDDQVASQRVVWLFLKACEVDEGEIAAFREALGELKDQLTFGNLFELLERFGKTNDEAEFISTVIKSCIEHSEAGKPVFQCTLLREVFVYLPQLFPTKFENLILKTEPEVLTKLEEALTNEPWIFGYSNVIYKKFKIPDCEASLQSYQDSQLIEKLSRVQKDALRIYKHLKHICKDYGHTFVKEESVVNAMKEKGYNGMNFEEIFTFLVENEVIHREVEKHRVYLFRLWKAEVCIAEKFASLLKEPKKKQLTFGIYFESKPYSDLVGDDDQVRAAMLISQQPVVVMSGRGGCGKTHVTSMLCQTMERLICQEKREKEALEKERLAMMEMERPDEIFSNDLDSEENSDQNEDSPIILLTAPTGKAAKLLGARAHMPSCSFTLHSVIYSYKAWNKNQMESPTDKRNPWKFSNVEVLVVDECSLVSVQTFSAVLRKLCGESKLRKVILLGDTHQLPSIQPGNFLADVYRSLDQIGCSVTLRTNHRTDCELLVENAGRIAQQQIPQIDPAKHFHQINLPEQDTGGEQIEAVRKLLNATTPAIGSHEKFQFVAFRRKDCDAINEICCQFYAKHPTKNEKNGPQFCINDKVCCKKNGTVTDYFKLSLVVDKVRKGHSNANDNGAVRNCQRNSNSPDKDGSKKDDFTEKLCNGEIFFIRDDQEVIEHDGKKMRFLTLDNLEKEVKVDYKELMRECSLQHAWAKTIHTYQGSKSDTVVYLVGSAKMQTWQHVYTAVTRGRKQVIIITRPSELRKSIRNDKDQRHSSLHEKLTAELEDLINTYNSRKHGKSPVVGHPRRLQMSQQARACQQDRTGNSARVQPLQQATVSQKDKMKKAVNKSLDFNHTGNSNRSFVSKSSDKKKHFSELNNRRGDDNDNDDGKVASDGSREGVSDLQISPQTGEESEDKVGNNEQFRTKMNGTPKSKMSAEKRKSDQNACVQGQEEKLKGSDSGLTPTRKGTNLVSFVSPAKMCRFEETVKPSPVRNQLEKIQLD